jgi:erythromycin esterase-like protein
VSAADAIRRVASPLRGSLSDYDALLELIGDASYVLLGEASHGTAEFYRERARITERLIGECGFNAVAVEADWPDAYRAARWARGLSGGSAGDALSGFTRFPTWMWRNTEVVHFLRWLRAYNGSRAPDETVGFWGLDLYSLYSSIAAVLGYLERVDPEGAKRARRRYGCFEHFGEDTQAYGYAATFGLAPSCEDDVLRTLLDLRQRALAYAALDGRVAEEEYFYAEQNARLVKNAEAYYRAMFSGRDASWNLRDQHMAETLAALVDYLGRSGSRRPRVVVWAHNSHLGDARATEMSARGELNVGQLVRTQHGRDAVLVGFTTYTGTVTAASGWDAPAERKWVTPALPGSWEEMLHDVGWPGLFLPLRGHQEAAALHVPRLERAIGVVYRPETERVSHYFRAELPSQFDAVLHFDETHAVEPLVRKPSWQSAEAPETYRSGL